MDKNKDSEDFSEKTLEAVWCVDSNNGDAVLMDARTNRELGRWAKKDLKGDN